MSSTNSSLENIAMFLLFFIVALIIVAFVYWLLFSIGLFMYARKQKVDLAGLAWVPVIQFFYLMYVYDQKFKPKFLLLYIGLIVIGATFILSFTGYPLPLGMPLVMGYAMFWLFRRHTVNLALQMTVMIITLGLSVPFQLMYLSGRPIQPEYIEDMDDFFDEPDF